MKELIKLASYLSMVSAGQRVYLTPVENNSPRPRYTSDSHPVVGEDRIFLTNTDDLQYYGNFLFGANQQTVKVLFDLGTSLTWIPSVNCNSNSTKIFNSANSNTFVNTTEATTISWGALTVKGFMVKDHVCVLSTSCSNKEL